jgi:hypothetical protein
MPQLNLDFIDIPVPQACLWESLNNEQRQLIIETLARLMLNAATPASDTEEPAND